MKKNHTSSKSTFFYKAKNWLPTRSDIADHSIQLVSSFADGAGWTAGVYFIDLLSLQTTWQWYLAKSFVSGFLSSSLSCGINYFQKKARPESTHETRWDDIYGVFLNNAAWQGTYDLSSLKLGQYLLYLFVPVGCLSTLAYSLPLICRYLYNFFFSSAHEFSQFKKKHFTDDLKSIFITFITCAAFVATSTPKDNFFYTETGYDTKAANWHILLADIARSGCINIVSYTGAALLIHLGATVKNCLTKSSDPERTNLLYLSPDNASINL